MCSINQWQLQWHFIDFYLSHHIHQWKLDINRLLLLYEIFDICSSHRTIATPHHPPSMDYHPTIIEHATQLCRTRRENCQLPGKVLFPEVPSMEQIHHHFLLPSPLLPHPQTPVTPPSHPQPNFHNWLKQLHEGIHGLLYAPPLPKKLEDESVSTTANINHTLTISTDGSFQQVGKTSPTRKSFLSGWSMSISAPHHSPTSP